LLIHTSGDLEEAFEWLDMLDREYNIFDDEYTREDFEEDLKNAAISKRKILKTAIPEPEKVKMY
jgi:hypothetical protein